MTSREIENTQRETCAKYCALYAGVSGDMMLGFAISTKGRTPVNGLRHPPEGDFSGWYLWCGEEFSDDADFFAPFHAYHVYQDYPEVVGLLGLPPGYRFLIAGKWVDVWYDESLVHVPSERNAS